MDFSVFVALLIELVTLGGFFYILKSLSKLLDKCTEYKKIQKNDKPSNSFSDLISILDKTIEQEIFFYLKLNLELKDIKIIDFDSALTSITTRIMTALSNTYINEITYYYNETWVTEYVVKKVRIFLTDYIRNNSI